MNMILSYDLELGVWHNWSPHSTLEKRQKTNTFHLTMILFGNMARHSRFQSVGIIHYLIILIYTGMLSTII